MPLALATVYISTIVHDQATSESIAERLRHERLAGPCRADAITALDHLGWTLLRQPEAVTQDVDDQGAVMYSDLTAYWVKEFDLPTDAERDLALAGAFEKWNWSLGWNYRQRDEENGRPDCEWWSEGPSHEYIVKTFGRESA